MIMGIASAHIKKAAQSHHIKSRSDFILTFVCALVYKRLAVYNKKKAVSYKQQTEISLYLIAYGLKLR